ncbi:hypothetical protein BHU72_07210 [Desulfuribacillus stibiiarsenatis]|uniref:4Fe-4S ferredoxin-type domain-containing protein n=1 Tax=Desulfuribacillus stibiiarsenatis TaxID=1390249 RepID=A0A1E5L4B5_9FIRM|nr:YdjY domain-containing protein [Desulfuribacillus stibiiarsenatis]OEH84972.1 hypothetical protein BHU72_07210 [Desulfuribacillus stibiiarsenatis]
MKKSFLFVSLAIILVFGLVLVGCGSKDAGSNAPQTPAQEATDANEVTEQNPLVINKENKSISVYGKVNGKYLVEPTRHGFNFHEGKYGDQAIFVAYANPLDVHDALVEIGAVPGNNLDLTAESDNKFIEGQDLDVTITWENAGKEYNMNEVLVDSNNQPFAFKFGGNYDRAKEIFTGCLLCLDSCPVGITSNSSHPTKTFADKKGEFRGNKDVLPGDGTGVVITYTIK